MPIAPAPPLPRPQEIVDELARTKADFSAFERKDIKYREDIKHEVSQKKKFKGKVKKAAEDRAKLAERLEQGEKDLPTLEQKLSKLTDSKDAAGAELEKIADGFKAKTEPLRMAMEGNGPAHAPRPRTSTLRSLFPSRSQAEGADPAQERPQRVPAERLGVRGRAQHLYVATTHAPRTARPVAISPYARC